MKKIAGFAARRVANGKRYYEAGYFYNTGKKIKTKTVGSCNTSERKFKSLKIFGTMEEALQYCREQEELTSLSHVQRKKDYLHESEKRSY